jgi:DNA-binding transcriptional LysR family regulator
MVERLMDQLTRAVTAVQTLSTDAQGSVAVAAGSSVISLIIAPAVVRLASSYPSISVRIIEHAGRGLASRVMKGEADFGIAALTGPTDALESELLVKDRFGVLCARDHPLAGKSRNVIWSDLTRYPFVTLASGTDTREMLARRPGVTPHLPRPTYEVASLSALFALVERGAGFTLLPGIAALPALRQNLLFRAVYKPTMFRELYFVCEKKAKLTPAAAQLACAILDEIMTLKKRTKLSQFVELAQGLQVLQHELHR